MSPSCPQRGHCPKTRLSKLQALIAESGVLGTTLHFPAVRVMERLAECDVLSVTSNTTAVLTSMGRPGAPQIAGDPLRSETGRPCLRLHPQSLGSVLAVERIPSCRKPYSLHVFDRDGAAVYEAYLTSFDDALAYGPDISEETGGLEGTAEAGAPWPGSMGWMPRTVTAAPANIDAGYHFDSVLGDNGIGRRASLPSWGAGVAWQIPPARLVDFFAFMCDIRMPAGIAVGNAGLVHYHQGALDALKASPRMLRISSKHSNVTISLPDVEEVWVSRVETRNGTDHLLEIYDWRYHCVAQFKAVADNEPLLRDVWRRQLCAIPHRSA